MRSRGALLTRVLFGAVFLLPASGFAQAPANQPVTAPEPATDSRPRLPAGSGPDPVLGSIDGKLIYLSDLTRATNALPEELRQMPFESVMPVLLDRIIDHQALTMMASRAGLEQRPEIQREIRAAADVILERAWLAQITPPMLTDEAIEARFNRQYANRPATEEVRARHILLGTEAEANAVLAQVTGGADFASIARAVSKDPDSKQGGDLGFFRRDQVWPGFADAAFALQPGQVSPVPIHNEFGWHVVKVEERRLVTPPTLSEVRDKIRRELAAQAVQTAVADARGQMNVHKFNLDGSEIGAGPFLSGAGSGRPR